VTVTAANMSSPNFIDYIKFNSRSGHGGAGCRHFHREKFIDKAAPTVAMVDVEVHVILKGNSQLWTLLHLKYRKHVIAEGGEGGEGQNMTGALAR